MNRVMNLVCFCSFDGKLMNLKAMCQDAGLRNFISSFAELIMVRRSKEWKHGVQDDSKLNIND
uniref:Uncharacterized protein n=1 Tax=Anguilla anguilla TaxID=7936 RepID=A0A0E9VEM9_ANGAN